MRFTYASLRKTVAVIGSALLMSVTVGSPAVGGENVTDGWAAAGSFGQSMAVDGWAAWVGSRENGSGREVSTEITDGWVASGTIEPIEHAALVANVMDGWQGSAYIRPPQAHVDPVQTASIDGWVASHSYASSGPTIARVGETAPAPSTSDLTDKILLASLMLLIGAALGIAGTVALNGRAARVA